MKTVLPLVVLLACSCAVSHHPGAPTTLNKDFRRQNHEAFSRRERELIRLAQWHIAQSGKRPAGASQDAYFRVKPTAEGVEVFVTYVTGYKANQPVLEPCLHNAVLLRDDGSLIRVLTGPECWP